MIGISARCDIAANFPGWIVDAPIRRQALIQLRRGILDTPRVRESSDEAAIEAGFGALRGTVDAAAQELQSETIEKAIVLATRGVGAVKQLIAQSPMALYGLARTLTAFRDLEDINDSCAALAISEHNGMTTYLDRIDRMIDNNPDQLPGNS